MKLVLRIIKGKINKNNLFCSISIEFDNNIAKVRALIDTGNLLKEPITGEYVVVVEKDALSKTIPPNILENIELILKGSYDTDLGQYSSRLRVIPFTSLGKENGILLGIKPDKILIELENETINVDNAICGIYCKKLTKNGLYNALIGLDILERRDIDEFAIFTKK